jgi:hypothetical protein
VQEQQPFSEPTNKQFKMPYSSVENPAEVPRGPVDKAYGKSQEELQGAVPEMSPEIAVQWVGWVAQDVVHTGRGPALDETIYLGSDQDDFTLAA